MKSFKTFFFHKKNSSMKEEVEQIDEISDKLKASYLDKAVQQRYDFFKEPWDPKKEPKWATPGGKPKKGYYDQPHKVKAREKDNRRGEIIDKTAEKLTGKPHYSQMSTMDKPAVHGNAGDWWKGKKYSKEEVEIDEAKKPKPGHNAAILSKNISKIIAAIKKEEVELDEAGYDAEYVKKAIPHLKYAVDFHKDYEDEHLKKSVSGTPEYVKAHRVAADAHKHAAQKFKIAHAQLSHGTKDVEHFVSDARQMGARAEKLTAAANKLK